MVKLIQHITATQTGEADDLHCVSTASVFCRGLVMTSEKQQEQPTVSHHAETEQLDSRFRAELASCAVILM